MTILIIGLGSIAKKHIQALFSLYDDITIYALRHKFSLDIIDGVNNIYDLSSIDVSSIDFIIISNPTSEHYKTINELANLQVPLFIEKPLFDQLNSKNEDLINKVISSGVSTYVACNLRFLDSLQYFKSFLQDLRINEVNIYCGSYLPDWRPGIDFRSSYSANKEMGGGVHIDLIHEPDYLYWLFGSPINFQSYFRSQSSLGISAIDYANYIWDYGSFSASVVLNYYRREPKRTMEVLTDKGEYSIDLLKNEVFFNSKIIYSSEKRIVDTYTAQMQFFIQEILGKGIVFNSIEEANNILKLCIKG